MKIYSVKRYKINNKLKKAIKNYPSSLDNMSKLLGFEVKNIYFRNTSIKEEHWKKLRELLQTDINLKEMEFDFTKNLGTKAFTQPIKIFKKSPGLAEFFGIMLGDGNIWKNQLTISFDKRNEFYINYVRDLSKKLFGIDLRLKLIKDTNQAHLYCYNKFLIQRLLTLGLMRGHKIKNQVGVSAWIKENKNFSKSCVRGLIDTDGCIYKCKKEKQIYIKFTNFNKQLLKNFKEITDNLGYSFAKANKNNWCLYRKDQVAKFIKDIKPLKARHGGVVQLG